MSSLPEILALTREYNKTDASNFINWKKSGTSRIIIADDGELQLPNATASGQGILLGGDVELYRSAANVLTIADTIAMGANYIGFDGTASEGISVDTDGMVTISNAAHGTPWTALKLLNNPNANPNINRGPALDFWGPTVPSGLLIGRIAAQYENGVDSKAGLRFYTYTGASLTAKWRISDVGVFTSLDAAPANVNVLGSIIASGGVAIGADALNNMVDDASNGTGSTTLYIGTQRILTANTILGASGSLTIASGAVAVTQTYHKLVVEGGTGAGADALTSATGGVEGQLLILSPATSGANDTVTVTDGTGAGTFILSNGTNFVMDSVDDTIILIHNGTEWKELARSSNS